MKCWICGANADSGEHLVKASDIRAVFGPVSQIKPLFFHTKERRNRSVPGVRANILKSGARICAKCNNQRTQPHDRAWENLSQYLRSREPFFRVGDRVRLAKVFPGAVRSSMLRVHLYFVKVFGCLILEHDIPINLELFSKALIQETPHPYIYIGLCPPISRGLKSVGMSDVNTASLHGRVVFAVWYYMSDRFSVRIMYAEPSERRQGLVGAWHPASASKCIRVMQG